MVHQNLKTIDADQDLLVVNSNFLSYPDSPWYRLWIFELVGAFYLWFAGLALVLLIAVGWLKLTLERNSLRGILAIALTFYASTILPWYLPQSQAIEQGTPLTVMTYNVNHKQWDLEQVATTVRLPEAVRRAQSHPVDIFSLVEPNKEQAAALREALRDLYPYYYRATGGGSSLFSRYPIQSPRTENFGAQDHSLVANFEIANQSIQVIVTHPFVPRSRSYFQRRNELIAAIAQYARQNPTQPLIVMGDFNATSWSAYVRNFERVSGLRNVALGYGLKSTWFYWGTNQPFSLESCIKQLFKIPIDHIFVSPDLNVDQVKVLPSGASDHRPILTQIRL
ncbi:MAG: endonuclease/exonuclease/phosphatase family protein [Spirulinaceae cyanobacterium]